MLLSLNLDTISWETINMENNTVNVKHKKYSGRTIMLQQIVTRTFQNRNFPSKQVNYSKEIFYFN